MFLCRPVALFLGSFSTSVFSSALHMLLQCTGLNGRISMAVRCYITALLTLPAAEKRSSTRLAAAVLCRAGSWQALWTVVLLTLKALSRAALSGKLLGCCHLFRTFLKMLKQSTLHSFDTKLFVTELENLPAIWDSRSSSYRNKQENPYAWETLCKTFIENSFLFL